LIAVCISHFNRYHVKQNRNWLTLFFLFVGTLSIATSCAKESGAAGGQETVLNAVEFNNEFIKHKEAVLLDVRTPEEFVGGHIKSAVNIDYNGADFKSNANKIAKDKPVYIYCRSGSRSAAAAKIMRTDGYNVIELNGGIMKWQASGFPVVTGVEVENGDSGMNGGSVIDNESGMNIVQFNKLLETPKLVLVDFNAVWCGPCKRMEPFLKQLSTEMSSTLEIIRIDVDENPSIATAKNIEALPTFHAYKNGKLVWQGLGYMSKNQLQKKLKTL